MKTHGRPRLTCFAPPTGLEDLAEQLEQFGQDLDGSPKLQKRIEGIVDRLDKVHDEIKPRRTDKLIVFPKVAG